MRLTKEEFISGLTQIKLIHDESLRITNMLGVDTWIPDEWMSSFENFFIKMCDLPDTDFGNDVEYFIYELNWGKYWKPGMIKVNGIDVKLQTIDDLWDFITNN